MTNEAIFSREAALIISINQKHKVVQAIKKFKEKRKEASYHDALECIGSLIGVEHHVLEIVNPRTGKVTGYWSAIKYYEGNAVNGSASIKKFMDAPYRSKDEWKAYDYLGRKYVHTLMDEVPDLAARLFGEGAAELK